MSSSDDPKASKKRKRAAEAPEELEVDIHAPEPPSKKALRKANKTKSAVISTIATGPNPTSASHQDRKSAAQSTGNLSEKGTPSRRSDYGVWIGNLLYTVTQSDLRTFFTNETNIARSTITRIHMPAPNDSSSSRQKTKPQNKGFAYVDFSTPGAAAEAVALSETLLAGRKVLIKDASNFEGRPDKKDDTQCQATKALATGKSPSKRIFVGNLAFDTEKGDLKEHFAQCGEVVDVHVTTFEDSGKCKGYAWITFQDVGAAEAAVRGWILKKPESLDEQAEKGEDTRRDEDGSSAARKKRKKEPKERKWYINKVKGRTMRMEFAEDASLRYKKRFGKEANTNNKSGQATSEGEVTTRSVMEAPTVDEVHSKPKAQDSYIDRSHHSYRSQKISDARNVRPGAALAAAPRLTGGIVASQGTKTTFA
ncbi:MAG: hypothetical protein Q9201_004079 [Fulgogasparrea decipioides]